MFRRVVSWFQSLLPFQRRWRPVDVDEVPDELQHCKVYLVLEDEMVWQAVMTCPCGCRATIQLCCLPNTRPRWSYRNERDGTITLHLSVWRNTGCRSHFFLRYGRIVWC